MVSIMLTDKAASKIKELKEKEGNPNLALRIFITGGGCCGFKYGMALDDKVYDDDIVVEQNGVKVVVDQFSATYLDGSEIDYVESLMGSGFAINNPNVTQTCSCGQSVGF